MLALVPSTALAAPLWTDNGTFIDPNPNDLTHHVELSDLDGDGDVDFIVVNNTHENQGTPGSTQFNRVYLNDGTGLFAEDDGSIFEMADNVRVVKTGDVNGDGNIDIVAGATWSGNSYILFGDGGGNFTSGGSLPGGVRVGDLDLGDYDNDGDLDIVASDYGTQSDLGAVDDIGAVLQLWQNDGSGNFTNTDMFSGTFHVAYSKRVSFVDIDNDLDLDVVAASHGGGTEMMNFDAFPQNRVFVNNDNTFSEVPQDDFVHLRVCTNFSVIDFDNDGFLDLFTLQDGGQLGDTARRDRVLLNNTDTTFSASSSFLSNLNNTQALHQRGQIIDFNHDQLPDIVVAGLDNPNDNFTLLRNDGAELVAADPPFEMVDLSHITSTALADVDGDLIDDIVVGQHGSFNNNFVLNGTADLGVDMAAPIIGNYEVLTAAMVGETVRIRARIHDNKNPTKPHDWLLDGSSRVMPYIEYVLNLPDPPTPMEFDDLSDNGETEDPVPTVWIGEYMHRGSFVIPLADTIAYRFCAIDHAGNKTCSPPIWLEVDQAVCGDGIVTEPEMCDDAIDDNCIDCFICGDGICSEGEENCEEDCLECGNDVVEAGEECDDSNDPACIMCLICGNGICSPGEECPEDCGSCGDGQVSGNEECDDPNDPNCIMCFVCGNGVCSVGEEPYCPEDCNEGPVCGDGVIEGMEECDDPDDSRCNLCQVCGNGICSTIEEENNLCPEDCMGNDNESESDSDTDMCDSAGADPETCLDDDGCGCTTNDHSAWYSLALLGLLGLRRRRD